jgi:hypothetical protein
MVSLAICLLLDHANHSSNPRSIVAGPPDACLCNPQAPCLHPSGTRWPSAPAIGVILSLLTGPHAAPTAACVTRPNALRLTHNPAPHSSWLGAPVRHTRHSCHWYHSCHPRGWVISDGEYPGQLFSYIKEADGEHWRGVKVIQGWAGSVRYP